MFKCGAVRCIIVMSTHHDSSQVHFLSQPRKRPIWPDVSIGLLKVQVFFRTFKQRSLRISPQLVVLVTNLVAVSVPSATSQRAGSGEAAEDFSFFSQKSIAEGTFKLIFIYFLKVGIVIQAVLENVG